MGFIGGRWCNSNGLFFWPSQRSLLWLQSSCMFDYVTFHFYWVYGCERSKRHIFWNRCFFFLLSKCIPCRKSFFSYCLHKCLFKIYLMAMIVWTLCWRDCLLNIYRLNHLYHHQPIFVEESRCVCGACSLLPAQSFCVLGASSAFASPYPSPRTTFCLGVCGSFHRWTLVLSVLSLLNADWADNLGRFHAEWVSYVHWLND